MLLTYVNVLPPTKRAQRVLTTNTANAIVGSEVLLIHSPPNNGTMPPKQASAGRPAGSKNTSASTSSRAGASKPSTASAKSAAKGKRKQRAESGSESPELGRRADHSMEAEDEEEEEPEVGDDEEEEEPAQTIPPDLLSRILHEFFEKDGTRITKPANSTVAKYMDVFVKEAIARAAAERTGGFLEVRRCATLAAERMRTADNAPSCRQVEDLEKIAPQLLLDL